MEYFVDTRSAFSHAVLRLLFQRPGREGGIGKWRSFHLKDYLKSLIIILAFKHLTISVRRCSEVKQQCKLPDLWRCLQGYGLDIVNIAELSLPLLSAEIPPLNTLFSLFFCDITQIYVLENTCKINLRLKLAQYWGGHVLFPKFKFLSLDKRCRISKKAYYVCFRFSRLFKDIINYVSECPHGHL